MLWNMPGCLRLWSTSTRTSWHVKAICSASRVSLQHSIKLQSNTLNWPDWTYQKHQKRKSPPLEVKRFVNLPSTKGSRIIFQASFFRGELSNLASRRPPIGTIDIDLGKTDANWMIPYGRDQSCIVFLADFIGQPPTCGIKELKRKHQLLDLYIRNSFPP